MKAAGWMIAASVVSALTAGAVAGRPTVADVLLGMLAPLAAVGVSWVLIERTYRRDPERLTPLITGGN